ncbi:MULTISPECIES: hypothetical protein [unclassified Acidiphilium]|uniref:hypothetical protein n=1 Tax=unclassified Acidiphilium TaxID=2617493 RepID=UPI0025BC2E47|nr:MULTISPECIES: hypothetical protein [unclassified Acidiphilium]HQT61925.1 hypothetical protein [Acidiphilium sp.]
MDDGVIRGSVGEFDLKLLTWHQREAWAAILVGEPEYPRCASIHIEAARSGDKALPSTGGRGGTNASRAGRSQGQARGGISLAFLHPLLRAIVISGNGLSEPRTKQKQKKKLTRHCRYVPPTSALSIRIWRHAVL